MFRRKWVKRRTLRQAVQENVDTLRGTYRDRSRLGSWLGVAKALSVVALPALLFTSYLLASIAESRSDDLAAPGTLYATPLAAEGEVVPEGAQAGLAAIGLASSAVTAPPGAEVFPLSVRRVLLDPGHGGKAQGTEGPGGVIEKELTLDIARRVERLLGEMSFEVQMTRDSDVGVSLEERARIANESRADIFVSIHVNWLENGGRKGIETYYLGPTDDPYLTRLAARENQESSYSLADLRDLLASVYANARQGESRRLASQVHQALYGALRRISPELEDRGVRTAPFVVLTGTEMPAILAEVSCLSNEEEARLLKLPEYRQYIAEALSHGVESYSRLLSGRNLSES